MKKNKFKSEEIYHYFFISIFIIFFIAFRFDISSFSTGIIGDGTDNLLNLTIIENNIQNIREICRGASILSIYKSNAHYPYSETTLFTEPLYFQTLLYIINQKIGFGQSASYNILFLWAFILNFFAMYFLSKVMKLSGFLPILLSTLYSSSHLISIQYIHLQNQFMFGFPLVAAFSILAIEKLKMKYYILMAFSINIQFFACAYYGLYCFYFSIFFPILIILFHPDYKVNFENKNLLQIITKIGIKFFYAPLLAIIPIGIFYIPFRYITRNLSFERYIEENEYFSNTFLSIFKIPKSLTYYYENLFLEGVTHDSFFLGYSLFLFVLFIIISALRKNKVRFIFLFLALVFFILSLGPSIDIFSIKIIGPYKLLYDFFPGFSSLRVPNRISVIANFFVFLFLFDFLKLKHNSKLNSNKFILSVLSLMVFFEYGYLPNIKEISYLPNQIISNNLNTKFPLNKMDSDKVVLFLDFNDNKYKYITGPVPEYIALRYGFRTINGYSGYVLPFQNYIETSLQDENVYNELFAFLNNLGLTHLIILNYDNSFLDYLALNQGYYKSINLDLDNYVEIELNRSVNNDENEIKNGILQNYKVLGSSNPKKEKFLLDSNASTYWEGIKSGIQSNQDFIKISLNEPSNEDLVIYMENGSFVNRFAYGLDVICDQKLIGGYSLPKFSKNHFLENPYGDQHLIMTIPKCKSREFELRINKTTKYSFWTISNLKVYTPK